MRAFRKSEVDITKQSNFIRTDKLGDNVAGLVEFEISFDAWMVYLLMRGFVDLLIRGFAKDGYQLSAISNKQHAAVYTRSAVNNCIRTNTYLYLPIPTYHTASHRT